ncbi:MAG: hypothetical protein COU32_04310 [Candidatus Magasanikbacteria bacterium CG10_big_fil_rev_8_21_14_0_10_42_10]|uniref:Cell division protein FtsL n=2 Tax=Candidatus Magasanikiibacteriota TaxID=1752731 RepID=A0A2H0TV42_9BACT|nr:MAG: hypothetical protein COU32_04310 [Candidatus Magasanikbacteria bacterium CG10_big_fil_rev_8_21_14_0_10_42_10]PIZ92843.1 MAG: hypothetical protein COX82_03985 [Candidatus Magasanikbacteria bacterium CG_4_10_14_0_2_um_filter_41_10]
MNAYLKKTPTLREKRLAVQHWLVSTTFRSMLLVAIVIFGVLYLFKINTVSTQGFVISDLQDQVTQLERENKRLDVEVASHRSMNSIEGRLSGTNLVAVGDMQYVTPVGTAFARAN